MLLDLKALEKYLDISCKLPDLKHREAGINEYIARNKVEKYIIIDDDISEYTHRNPRLYLVNAKTGFTKKDVKKCQKLINS